MLEPATRPGFRAMCGTQASYTLVACLEVLEQDLDDPFHLVGGGDLQQLRQDLHFAIVGHVARQLVQVLVQLTYSQLHLLWSARLSAAACLEEVLQSTRGNPHSAEKLDTPAAVDIQGSLCQAHHQQAGSFRNPHEERDCDRCGLPVCASR